MINRQPVKGYRLTIYFLDFRLSVMETIAKVALHKVSIFVEV